MRSTSRPYHHGNLRSALVEAAVALARDGGPDAVVLRAATTMAGVSPNAAYRHFTDRDALVLQVCAYGMTQLGRAMQVAVAQLEASSAKLPATELARQRLLAVGRAYVRYALTEPGLFRTAFAVPKHQPADPDAGDLLDLDPAHSPFLLLGAALDGLVAAGALPPQRRPGAEISCWAAVHGLATLYLDGPLAGMPVEQQDEALEQLLSTIDRGL